MMRGGGDLSGRTRGLAPIGPRKSMYANKENAKKKLKVRVRPLPSASAEYIKPLQLLLIPVLMHQTNICTTLIYSLESLCKVLIIPMHINTNAPLCRTFSKVKLASTIQKAYPKIVEYKVIAFKT